MRLETINFPSDPDSAFGGLSRELVRALHKAAEHPDHADLLGKFLNFSTRQLVVARKDYKDRLGLMKKRADKKLAAEEAAKIAELEARYTKVGTELVVLTDEQAELTALLGKDS
jgi:hypothetical protein